MSQNNITCDCTIKIFSASNDSLLMRTIVDSYLRSIIMVTCNIRLNYTGMGEEKFELPMEICMTHSVR